MRRLTAENLRLRASLREMQDYLAQPDQIDHEKVAAAAKMKTLVRDLNAASLAKERSEMEISTLREEQEKNSIVIKCVSRALSECSLKSTASDRELERLAAELDGSRMENALSWRKMDHEIEILALEVVRLSTEVDDGTRENLRLLSLLHEADDELRAQGQILLDFQFALSDAVSSRDEFEALLVSKTHHSNALQTALNQNAELNQQLERKNAVAMLLCKQKDRELVVTNTAICRSIQENEALMIAAKKSSEDHANEQDEIIKERHELRSKLMHNVSELEANFRAKMAELDSNRKASTTAACEAKTKFDEASSAQQTKINSLRKKVTETMAELRQTESVAADQKLDVRALSFNNARQNEQLHSTLQENVVLRNNFRALETTLQMTREGAQASISNMQRNLLAAHSRDRQAARVVVGGLKRGFKMLRRVTFRDIPKLQMEAPVPLRMQSPAIVPLPPPPGSIVKLKDDESSTKYIVTGSSNGGLTISAPPILLHGVAPRKIEVLLIPVRNVMEPIVEGQGLHPFKTGHRVMFRASCRSAEVAASYNNSIVFPEHLQHGIVRRVSDTNGQLLVQIIGLGHLKESSHLYWIDPAHIGVLAESIVRSNPLLRALELCRPVLSLIGSPTIAPCSPLERRRLEEERLAGIRRLEEERLADIRRLEEERLADIRFLEEEEEDRMAGMVTEALLHDAEGLLQDAEARDRFLEEQRVAALNEGRNLQMVGVLEQDLEHDLEHLVGLYQAVDQGEHREQKRARVQVTTLHQTSCACGKTFSGPDLARAKANLKRHQTATEKAGTDGECG